jgi:hypothetical protein
MNFRIPFFALLLLLGYAAFAYSGDRGEQLFYKVLARAQECNANKSGSEVSSCMIKATPKKCQPQMIYFLSREDKDEARRALYFCVASCADAGFWSTRFGECSRELK